MSLMNVVSQTWGLWALEVSISLMSILFGRGWIRVLMHDTIYYLTIVIYYFWYFFVKNVILGLGNLFPYFQVHLMLFRSNLIPHMVRYQLGVILDDIFLYAKFYGALKQASKSVNVFKNLLNKKIRKCEALLFFWFFKNCELIRDSSLWRSNFIPLVRDSIVIIGLRSVYTFSS